MEPWATAEDFACCCPREDPPQGGRTLGGAGETLAPASMAAADDALTAALARACDTVDAVCFGRVRRIGFARLQPWQQALLVRAACLQAAWFAAWGEAVSGPLASYGINGVSMAFDQSKVKSQNGAAVSSEVYGLLVQTGLAHRGIW